MEVDEPDDRMRLGEKLVQDGVITEAQLDTALRAQVVYGGRIGTNLIELDFVSLDTLTRALAELKGVPAALEMHFDAVDPATLQLLSPRLAEKHQAIPLGLARLAGRQLVVAFVDPDVTAAQDEIGLATGSRITPCVAPELRIVHYLEKFYGIPRKHRYLRVDRDAAGGSGPVRLPTPAPAPPPAPGANLSAQARAARSRRRLGPDEPTPKPSIQVQPTPPPVIVSPRPPLSAPAAIARLEEAATREEIGDVVVDYLRSAYGCGLLFIARDQMALGWKGFAAGVPLDTIEALVAPLRSPSMLRLAYEGRAVFRGAPPADGGQIQQRLWKALRLAPPREVIVAPVIVAGRVVNLAYAHAADGGAISEGAAAELTQICTAASAAFLRLLRLLKGHDPTPHQP